MKVVVFSSCMFLCLVNLSLGAKILGIFSTHSKSHVILGQELLKGLAERGHQVTMLSGFPLKTTPPNYRDVNFKTDIVTKAREMMPIKSFFEGKTNLLFKLGKFYQFGAMLTDISLSDESTQYLLNAKNETFDAVILHAFLNEAIMGVAHKLDVPLIVFSCIGPSALTDDFVGNPSHPAYVPNAFFNMPRKMNFKDRFLNSVGLVATEIGRSILHFPKQRRIYEKYFPDAPDFDSFMTNTSLVLVNSHFSISPPRPMMPNCIEIGGFHVPEPKPLPIDLQKFLDDAQDGVIYFSLGSNAQSKDMPADMKETLVKVFSRLKQKVLWKWEADTMSGKPDNVKIAKWLPQTDILAHPNVRLFITHGGWGSVTESMVRGVPIVGIPLFAEQHKNVHIAVEEGFGVQLELQQLTETSLHSAINEVLNNPSYKNAIAHTSKLFRDRELKPMDRAAYWIEYVIRTNGARHLRSSSLDLNIAQLLLLDVIAAVLLVLLLVLGILYVIVRLIYKKIKQFSSKTSSKKKTH